MQHLWIVIGLALSLGFVTPSDADTMRCETGRIVSTGDDIDEVRDKCGKPTKRRKDKRCRDLRFFEDPHTRTNKSSRASKCIAVEIWTYDFGPRRLTHTLTFSDGRLRLIATGDYGK